MSSVRSFPLPATRDPFVNTPLVPAGIDEKTGEERFFTSTWNANVGCVSALITPSGRTRIYRQPKGEGIAGCGAYSAVCTDPDTMWVCSDLARVGKLTLSTGEVTFYPTGAGSGLVFCGMQYDEPTGKLLFMANTFIDPVLTAVSFDTRTKKTVHIYAGFTKASLGDGGFANGDGTYSLRVTTGYSALYTWDPAAETLTFRCEINSIAHCSRVIFDEEHTPYIALSGWLRGDNTIADSPRPETDKRLWFGRSATVAYGAEEDDMGLAVFSWEIATGKVTPLCYVPNGTIMAVALTQKEEILAVSLYGMFSKYNKNGDLLLSKPLDSSAVGAVDCLISIDQDRLLGTPFISQRFWTANAAQGTSVDCGRAASGRGEVLRLWNINQKIYMASYTEGILTEYDPKAPITFPENPRIVAKSPHGMRPVAHTDDGQCLYYACNHHYGTLGCELTRYDTVTGEAFYRDNPLPHQHIISLCYHDGYVYGTTTFRSDCDTSQAMEDTCYVVKIDPETLETKTVLAVEQDIHYPYIIGDIDGDTLMIDAKNKDTNHMGWRAYSFSSNTMTVLTDQEENEIISLRGAGINRFAGLTRQGEVALYRTVGTEFGKTEMILPENSGVNRIFGEPGRVMAVTDKLCYVIDLDK